MKYTITYLFDSRKKRVAQVENYNVWRRESLVVKGLFGDHIEHIGTRQATEDEIVDMRLTSRPMIFEYDDLFGLQLDEQGIDPIFSENMFFKLGSRLPEKSERRLSLSL